MSGLPVKVSVIIPVYNVEKYLSACLNSCVHQTLNDIEIICVNDGSTDRSRQILEEFAKRDYRIKIVDKPNGGLSSARNAGIDCANGEMIMFLDSDDYIALNACERVWCETKEAPTDVVIFGTEILPEKPRATSWYYNVLSVRTHRRNEFTADVLFKEPAAKPFVWRHAYHRKFFTEYGLRFDERVKYGEDTVFQMEAIPYGTHFSFIADKLYYYRWYREGSLMQTNHDDMDEKIRKHLILLQCICQYWKQQGWFALYGKSFVEWMLEFIVVDVRNPEVLEAQSHLAALAGVIQEYQLGDYLDGLSGRWREYARSVKRGKL